MDYRDTVRDSVQKHGAEDPSAAACLSLQEAQASMAYAIPFLRHARRAAASATHPPCFPFDVLNLNVVENGCYSLPQGFMYFIEH